MTFADATRLLDAAAEHLEVDREADPVSTASALVYEAGSGLAWGGLDPRREQAYLHVLAAHRRLASAHPTTCPSHQDGTHHGRTDDNDRRPGGDAA